jgi:hypothetical protein
MPIFALQLKADLEGVGSIDTTGRYCLDLSKDGEGKKGIYVDQSEVVEMVDSRGTCHLQIKLPGMSKPVNLVILETFPYRLEDSGNFKTVARIEARGLDVDAWQAREDFVVVSEGGKRFENADLGEGDYTEYDDEHEQAVSVLEIETKVVVVKDKKK